MKLYILILKMSKNFPAEIKIHKIGPWWGTCETTPSTSASSWPRSAGNLAFQDRSSWTLEICQLCICIFFNFLFHIPMIVVLDNQTTCSSASHSHTHTHTLPLYLSMSQSFSLRSHVGTTSLSPNMSLHYVFTSYVSTYIQWLFEQT
jgi:hypothetical protein